MQCIFIVSRSTFFRNGASAGSAISFVSPGPKKYPLYITECTFTQHDLMATSGSVIHFSNVYLHIKDSNITNNKARGIYIIMSFIEVSGKIWIEQNNADTGAGILIDCYSSIVACKNNQIKYSRIILTNGTNLHIGKNTAKGYGGALMVKSGCVGSNVCFIQTTSNYTLQKNIVHMNGNTAGVAGDSIYGGDLENCYFESINDILTPKLFWMIINITEKNSSPSVVASPSYKVCLCNENFSSNHNCLFSTKMEVSPGQVFHIPVVGVSYTSHCIQWCKAR